MGEIIESTRRHYVGDDADKALIPAGGKSEGDSYHANDKGKQYYWNGTAWKTGLGYEFVPRAIAGADFAVGDLTLDGTWKVNGLDLSAIVPAGAVAVLLFGFIKDNAADQVFAIRGNATDKALNQLNMRSQVANIEYYMDFTVMIDADRLVDYNGVAGIDNINLYVKGWYI